MDGVDSEDPHLSISSCVSAPIEDSVDGHEPTTSDGRLATLSAIICAEYSTSEGLLQDEGGSFLSLNDLRAEADKFARLRRAGRAKKRAQLPKTLPMSRPVATPCATMVQLPHPPPWSDAEILRTTASLLRETREEPFAIARPSLSKRCVTIPSLGSQKSASTCVPKSAGENMLFKSQKMKHETPISQNICEDLENTRSEFSEVLVRSDGTLELEKRCCELELSEVTLRSHCLELETRYHELEKLVKSDCDVSEAMSDRDSEANDESCSNLRKHLTAYAREAVSLRRQIAQADVNLRNASEALGQNLRERDELVLHSKYLDSEVAHLRARCEELQELHKSEIAHRHKHEAKHSNMLSQFDVLHATLGNSQDFNRKVKMEAEGHIKKAESRILEKDKELAEKDKEMAMLQSFVKPLIKQIADLQSNYVAQTNKYSEFVSQIRMKQEQAHKEMSGIPQLLASQQQACNLLRDDLTHLNEVQSGRQESHRAEMKKDQAKIDELNGKICDFEEEVRLLQLEKQQLLTEKTESKASQEKTEKTEKNNPKSNPKSSKRSLNICKEMKQVCQHTSEIEVNYIDKTEQPWPTPKRFLRIDASENTLYCFEESQHGPKRDGIDNPVRDERVNLEKVIRIEYSGHSVPAIQYAGYPAWLGFSLYTVERSFDFMCSDEDSVRCLVLVLSRLCLHAHGRIASRGQFEAAKGWCKLDDMRLRHGKSWHQVLLKAMRSLKEKDKTASKPSNRSKAEARKSENTIAVAQVAEETNLVATDSNQQMATEGSHIAPENETSPRRASVFKGLSTMATSYFKSKRRTKRATPKEK